MLSVVRGRQPEALSYSSVQTRDEIAAASELFDLNGWTNEPLSYHRTPPPLRDRDVTIRGVYKWPRRHELVSFPSEFSPRSIEPAADRWSDHPGNDTVWVRLLRHRNEDRPWIVCLHGFGMGASRMDMSTLWATKLHTTFRYNVAVPVLPLHGPRNRPNGDQLLSLDLMSTVHGITQAVWDVRRLIQWIRVGNDGAPVGVYGVSLGGFLTALLSGIEPVECAVSGIPFVDVLRLMSRHDAPPGFDEILTSDLARNVFRVVSPLALTPQPPAYRRGSFAALFDQFIPQDQSIELQEAWPDSPAYWARGGHVGCLMSRGARGFVTNFFSAAL